MESLKKGVRYYVGIDPDVNESGIVAIRASDGKVISAEKRTLPLLVQAIEHMNMHGHTEDVHFVVEAGWLTSHNHHKKSGDSARVIAKKGNSVGRNGQTGRHIVEFLDFYQMNYDLKRPLRKIWKGRDGKITQAEIKKFIPDMPRCNQEARDAALLAWVAAGFPIKI